ncbi:Riboflavin synthase, alpha subunit [Lactobacillus helsingborgensis]|uniref:Riboflavin synthase n=1 Tax=Lactobacillus helsingborgensis TaxID=1218494 RepID=A0AA47GH60_9LACO|nr:MULTISPECIES: riboflavin synthase [Lactobacillus]AIS08636.1 Riboflavin synthase eubacterial/eukaryotic [Lactobacillus sp. wkB8]KJY65871.1 Riboflavin synthase, alpha subunit [Lactobacillus helsingborgensis]UZX29950.1 riboflavin synthase [Lactobacillus helsingborgensis]
MFTGIIQATGTITRLEINAQHARLGICASALTPADLPLGASIAVNGICLTVTDWSDNDFAVDVMPETMKRTNLGHLQKGSLVNLEPALALNGKLDGHIVAGHVDTTAELVIRNENENSIELEFAVPHKYAPFIVEKGSIAIDGISLTVTMAENDHFGVSLIPYTIQNTTLAHYQVGDKANIEVDMIGRYAVKQIQAWKKEF